MDSPTVKTLTISCSGAGLVASASYSPNCAVFEPGAKHTFDEGVGESAEKSAHKKFARLRECRVLPPETFHAT